ncbi:hypothetical protein QVL82_00540 [Cellulosimicrobium funkei]|uniref:hypothetical protein n=1 Tax=Cellulosimicrobium funkei TaxID=264251 RepID=UPI000397B21E
MDITEAAESGSRLDLLRSLRHRLATVMDAPETPSYALVALSKQLRDLDAEVRSMVEVEEQPPSLRVVDQRFDVSKL